MKCFLCIILLSKVSLDVLTNDKFFMTIDFMFSMIIKNCTRVLSAMYKKI